MLQVRNQTPFAAELFVLPDPEGNDTAYLTVKGTFTIGRAGVVKVADEQQPIFAGDEYVGDPATSSLRCAGEAHPCKSATDVVVIGSAHAPGGRPVPYFGVTLSVGHLRKLIHVYGDRVWKVGLTGGVPSAPEPTAVVPLTWERAFGGTAPLEGGDVSVDLRNPAGVGYRGGRDVAEMKGKPVPNLEDPRDPIVSLVSNPAPAGLGFISPSWLPRVAYAGTYDDEWLRSRAPFLPDDFDPRFLHAAPADQVYPGHLRGGEPVQVQNASPLGVQQFAVPLCELVAVVWVAGEAMFPALRIETLLLEPDQDRFSLLWRGAVPCEKRALQVEEAVLTVASMKGVA